MQTFSRLRRWSRLAFIIALLAVAGAGVFLVAPAPAEAAINCPTLIPACGQGHLEIIGSKLCCVYQCPWGIEIGICVNL